MLADDAVVIVGAGHAGFQAAKSLRDRGHRGGIVVIDQERGFPYQRPPLSKAYLTKKSGIEDLQFAPEDFYTTSDLTVRRGSFVESIDRAAKTVRLGDGTELPYGHLILATGAKARDLTVPGAELDGVLSLRTLSDADEIARRLDVSKSVVVIGAGFIGLEFVSHAAAEGHSPVVIEFAPRIMGRAASVPVSDYFLAYYRELGVQVLLGTGVTSIEGDGGQVTAVIDSNGNRHPADLVVVGIGVVPNVSLAESAGLAVNNGIVVDEQLSTSDPAISAIGDCCNYPSATARRRVRLESVQNATDHARNVAAKLTGAPTNYAELPWFWSDQGPKKLQMVGLNFGGDEVVVRGDISSGKFSIFVFEANRLVAVDSVDRPMDHMAGRRLLGSGGELSPEQAADMSFDLKAHALASMVTKQ